MWAWLLLAGQLLPTACYPAELVHVVDADTLDLAVSIRAEAPELELSCETKAVIRVRLDGVRAPETKGPDEELAERGRIYLEALFTDARKVEVCPRVTRRGKAVCTFCRTVATVRVDGIDVGTQLIKAGLARPGAKEGW